MINIIIPTFQAGGQFEKVLERLQKQKLNDSVELIIIDSGSSDQTLDLAHKFDAKIIRIKQHDFNHGLTRNKAIESSKSEFIALLTQDAIPADQFLLQNMLNSLEKYQAAGVYARQIAHEDASPLVKRDVSGWLSGSDQRRIQQIDNMNHFLSLSPMEQYQHCIFDNVASMIRRDVWEKIPFSPTPFGEDLEWGFRVLCAGHRIVYEPEAKVIHSHERSAKYVYKRVCVDHHRLNQLFGLRTVPTPIHLFRSFIYSSIGDMTYLLRYPSCTKKWWQNFLSVTLYSWASAYGQYQGAKLADRGVSLYQSKDV